MDTKCTPKHLISDAACETSVHDVLAPQPFQDSITTVPPTGTEVCGQERHVSLGVMLGPSKYVYVHTCTTDSHPGIPNPEDDKFHEYGVSEMEVADE